MSKTIPSIQYYLINNMTLKTNYLNHIVKRTMLLIGALLLSKSSLFAYQVVVDSVKYEVKDDYCSVVGYIEGITHAVIKDSVEGKIVTCIKESAFNNCYSLLSVDFSDGITDIERSAFYGCYSLASIAIPDSVTSIGNFTFYGCKSLTSLVIPNCVTSIGSYSFYGCSSLTTVLLPTSITTIGRDAFNGCTSLLSADIPEGLSCIDLQVFWGCISLTSVTIPESVTSIGRLAFYDCRSLKSIDIPEGVTSIGGSAFSGCSSLTSVAIPEGVTRIEDWCFGGCSSLTLVDIPKSVTSIGQSAFSSCRSLTSVNIPDGVTSIGGNAFVGCTSLRSLVIPEGVTRIEDDTFGGCSSLTSIIIPNGVTTIGKSAFDQCPSLTSIDIPNGVTSIGDYAFQFCSSLKSIVIPESVTSIGNYAFDRCISLTSIVISAGVNYYGTGVFTNITSVKYVKFKGNEIADFNVFSPIIYSRPLIFVDDRMYDSYASNPNWTVFSSNIISADMLEQRTIEVTADEGSSSLFTILGDSSLYTANLKVKGSINGYDIMTLRNKTFHLLYLDLSEADIVANDGGYEYYTGYSIKSDNVLGNYSFADLLLQKVILPNSLESIGNDAFNGCRFLEEAVLQDGLISIGDDAFRNCISLNEICLPSSLVEIGSNAFNGCVKLSGVLRIPDQLAVICAGVFAKTGIDSVVIGRYVSEIGSSAFYSCPNLKGISFNRKLNKIGTNAFGCCINLIEANLPYTVEVIEDCAFQECYGLMSIKIPSMTKRIGNSVFSGCDNLRNVYTYTVEPTEINQQTFSSYKYATLNVPKTSANLYTYNTQWSQFAFVREFEEPYDAFYLNGDVELDDNTGRMSGEPDAEMHETSGFIIDGEERQELSDIELLHNGKDGASIIGSSNLIAKSMKVNITVEGNRWYFFCFPFNVERDSIECTSDYAIYSYDGLKRAGQGTGWSKLDSDFGALQKGMGYIFQAKFTGVLTIHVSSEYLDFAANNESELLHAYESADASNASWNFIGNPFISYYDIQDLAAEYDAPIIVWNGYGYDVYKPGDDDYQLKPFEAFFVQKQTGKTQVNFLPDNRITYNQGLERKALHAKQREVMGTPISVDRQLVNITIMDRDSVTDRTRIVYSTKASMDYEIGVDAAKFHSDGVPQIYTLAGGLKYAINERAMGGDDIKLGYSAPKAGVYTLSVPRQDAEIEIYDNVAQAVVDFTFGDYMFESKAGTFNDRFVIRKTGGVTAVDGGFRLDGLTVVAVDGGIDIEGQFKDKVSVYSEFGMLIAEPAQAGRVELGDGTYIIKIGDRNFKMTVL